MQISLGIKSAVEKVYSEILSYESDTFSAQGSKLTRAEAQAVTAKLIESRLDIGNNVDGVSLSNLLDEVRG